MKRIFALLFILMIGRAVPVTATALFPTAQNRTRKPSIAQPRLPAPISFRVVKSRGLLATVWINEAGPFTFAIDTGAGITLISTRIAAIAGIASEGSSVSVGGLTGAGSTTAGSAMIERIAMGNRDNALRANQKVLVIDGLPSDIDGILDPTEALAPFGYTIDLPRRELTLFDARVTPMKSTIASSEGTVVRWIMNEASRRPFVRLGDGRIALLDTGSSFGLAIARSESDRTNVRRNKGRDIAGRDISSQRVAPSTITIGSLVLRGIPVDLLDGVEKGAPILLGRDALSPFRLTFDPVQKLIAIVPST
jgi:aspartyl protease